MIQKVVLRAPTTLAISGTANLDMPAPFAKMVAFHLKTTNVANPTSVSISHRNNAGSGAGVDYSAEQTLSDPSGTTRMDQGGVWVIVSMTAPNARLPLNYCTINILNGATALTNLSVDGYAIYDGDEVGGLQIPLP
jgi:hypothetical protein